MMKIWRRRAGLSSSGTTTIRTVPPAQPTTTPAELLALASRPHYRERRGKMSNILRRRMSFSGRELRRICPDCLGGTSSDGPTGKICRLCRLG